MPYAQTYPLGGNGDILQDLVRRVEVLEGRSRAIQNGSMVFTDGNGNNVVIVGQLPDGTYGIEVLDQAGTVQAKLGQITASPAIYGLATLPQLTGTPGALQMVGGKIFLVTGVPGTVSTAGVWTAYPGTNSVSFNIGPSVEASVTMSASMTIVTGGAQGEVGFSIDGGAVTAQLVLGGAANTAAVVSGTVGLPAGLSQGSHTIKFWYQTTGGSVSFPSNLIAEIEPL